MPKAIKSGAREMILKLKSFFDAEKEQGAPIIPFDHVNKRIAAATGIGLSTIYKIVQEGKTAAETDTKITTPGKTRRRACGKIDVDSFDQGVIRRKVHEFYAFKKELPTLNKLITVLRDDINFKGGKETLRKLLHKIGFRYRKTQSNRKVLTERNDISAWRAKYLQELKKNSLSPNPRPVIYLDETYIHSSHTTNKCWQCPETDGVLEPVSKGQRFIIVHAGGELGFVQNADLVFKSNTKSGDYHDEMNNKNFKKWLSEKLIPNLKEPSLIIMDNAPYHSIRVNKSPTTNTIKPEIQKWLIDNRIDFSSELTKPQLLEIVKRNKPEPVYEVDSLLAQHGHKCLRLPAYHCDLNPIEMVWSSMKRKVAEVNVEHNSQNIPQLISEAFSSIDASEWQKYCAHVHKIEEEYRRKNGYLDEPFIVNLDSDSDTDSDSDSDSDFEEISGIFPLDHTYAIGAQCAHNSASTDHNYCVKGFQ